MNRILIITGSSQVGKESLMEYIIDQFKVVVRTKEIKLDIAELSGYDFECNNCAQLLLIEDCTNPTALISKVENTRFDKIMMLTQKPEKEIYKAIQAHHPTREDITIIEIEDIPATEPQPAAA